MSDSSQSKAVADRLDRFAAAYLVLARAYGAPADQEFIDSLSAPGQLDSWPLTRDPETTEGLRLLSAALAGEVDLKALARDYQLLFIGPGSPLAVPYESVYRGKDGLLFDEATFEVRRAYQEFGLAAPKLNKEPDDHISLEFSFLSALCVRALDALERGDDLGCDRALAAGQAFLADHLLKWTDGFLDRLDRHSQTDFYRGISKLTRGTLAQAVISA